MLQRKNTLKCFKFQRILINPATTKSACGNQNKHYLCKAIIHLQTIIIDTVITEFEIAFEQIHFSQNNIDRLTTSGYSSKRIYRT